MSSGWHQLKIDSAKKQQRQWPKADKKLHVKVFVRLEAIGCSPGQESATTMYLICAKSLPGF